MKKLRITIGNKSFDVTVEDLAEDDSYQITNVPTAPPAATSALPATSAPASAPTARPPLPVEAGAVTSPMAGAIKAVLVKAGDAVKQGQPLVILEAMKMENQITAPMAGTVQKVHVSEGESVQEAHILVVLE